MPDGIDYATHGAKSIATGPAWANAPVVKRNPTHNQLAAIKRTQARNQQAAQALRDRVTAAANEPEGDLLPWRQVAANLHVSAGLQKDQWWPRTVPKDFLLNASQLERRSLIHALVHGNADDDAWRTKITIGHIRNMLDFISTNACIELIDQTPTTQDPAPQQSSDDEAAPAAPTHRKRSAPPDHRADQDQPHPAKRSSRARSRPDYRAMHRGI